MDDRFFVGHFEGICDLARDVQGLTNGQPLALCQLFRERLAVDELENEKADSLRLLHAVDRTDVRVIQRGEDPRLALEAGQALRVARELARQDLDRDLATEFDVARPVHFAHAARAEQRFEAISSKVPADHRQEIVRKVRGHEQRRLG